MTMVAKKGGIPTPTTKHMGLDFDKVYEPAEDTFLLLDSLEADEAALLATGALVRGDVKDGDAEGAVKDGLILEDLSLTDTRTDSRTGPRLCLEVGSGSGVVITFLAQLVQKLSPSGQDCRFIATDLNPACVAATGKTAEENGVGVVVDAVQCDLVAAVMDDVAGKVDVLVFNPPYVVTPSSEVGSQGIEASWAGGVDGREVTDRLLPLIPALLAPRGLFYLVALDENFKEGTPEDLRTAIPGFTCKVVGARKTGPEHLKILRFSEEF